MKSRTCARHTGIRHRKFTNCRWSTHLYFIQSGVTLLLPTYAYKTCKTTSLISPLPTHCCWKKWQKSALRLVILWAQKLQSLQVIRIQQEFLMANPSNSRTGVSCSCDGPGCSGFLSSRSYVRTSLCLRPSAAANAMSFSPKTPIGARWCYCLEFGDRNLRPVEDDVTLTHEHYVTARYVNVWHTAHVRHNSHTTLHT